MAIWNLDAVYDGKRVDIISNGLSIYLDSTNPSSYPGVGSVWYDLSGKSNHFTWDSVSFTSGSPSYFSTNGRKSSGPSSNSVGIDNTSGYTIFVIMRQVSLNNSGAFQFYRDNASATTNAARGIFSHLTWGDGNIYFDQGGCCGTDTRTQVSAGTTTTWNVYTLNRETGGSTRKIFKNGSVLTTNTVTAATLDLDSRAIDLGGTAAYSNWDAELGGFIVYNRGLSDTEVTEVYDVIKSRYGIT